MPTYEYACRECGEHLEVVQAFSDEALTECPSCGGPLRKVFGSVGIVFKGSGFYKTDSRSSTSAASTSAASPASDTTPPASSGSEKTDTAPGSTAGTPAGGSNPSGTPSSGTGVAAAS